MANVCEFDVKIVGPMENVKDFIRMINPDALKEDNDDNLDDILVSQKFTDIIDFKLYSPIEELDSSYGEVTGGGECYVSAFNSFLYDGKYSEIENEHPKEIKLWTCLEKVREKYPDLTVQIIGHTDGETYMEKITLNYGGVFREETKIMGYWYGTVEEAEYSFKQNPGLREAIEKRYNCDNLENILEKTLWIVDFDDEDNMRVIKDKSEMEGLSWDI